MALRENDLRDRIAADRAHPPKILLGAEDDAGVDEHVALRRDDAIEIRHIARHENAVAEIDRILSAFAVVDDQGIERLGLSAHGVTSRRTGNRLV